MAAAIWGGWFIPITVTAGGTVTGWVNGKLTDGVSFYDKENDPTPRDHTVRIWAGMVEDKKDSGGVNLQGFMPHVVLYDERGDMIGRSCGKRKYIKEGNFQDITIEPKDKNNVRAAYVRLFQWADDALCISAIQVTYPDSGTAMVYGDVPHRLCGWQGYTSITDVTAASGAGPPRRPFCFWMDANDSYADEDAPGEPWLAGNKHKAVSATFHLRDFHGENRTVSAYSNNTDLICKSSGRMQAHPWKPKTIAIFKPPLKYDSPDMLEDGVEPEANYLDPKFVVDSEVTSGGRNWSQSEDVPDAPMYDSYKRRPKKGDQRCGYKDPPGGWIKPPSRRSLSDNMEDWDIFHDLAQLDKRQPPDTRPLQQRFDNDILVTDEEHEGLLAEFVCANPGSVGPSLVNTFEGKYCDMLTHQVWPVCGADILDNCFLMQDMTVRGTGPEQSAGAFNNGSLLTAVAVAAPVLKRFTRIRRTF